MRSALILSFGVLFLVGCERRAKEGAEAGSVSSEVKSEKPMIRAISLNDTNGKIGVELNGDRAFLRQDSPEHKRTEIPYRDGLRLLEGFYAIPGIEEYRGKKSEDRKTSIQYLVAIYDEMPERYYEEWVDYVIPKDSVERHPELNAWFEDMRATQELADVEETGIGQPANRSQSKSAGRDKTQLEADLPSR